ncbi:MAG: methyltransferase domain-containing protein [Xanthomonadales bacterium]|nr:methyltransferase domain-containing protein [Xanthomonadales bacterium]MCP5475873.1 methyltransferase domain-containing protein [Rhodanobacteraceae bacterium]
MSRLLSFLEEGTPMSEVRSGVRHLLANPWPYDLFQHLIGAYRWRRRVVEELLVPALAADSTIVDIGCGTGEVLEYLPQEIGYIGFDRNPDYIAQAIRRFRERKAVFRCEELTPDYCPRDELADHALAFGLLHHLDNESATALFRSARRVLKPGGSLITLDPVYTSRQSRSARYVVSKDRGTEVRTESAYLALARASFARVEVFIDLSPLRIPYTGIVMRCS